MNTRQDAGTAKQLAAVLIAILVVVVAGLVVGQAPSIFGAEIDEEREASIEFEDQPGNGTAVVIDELSISHGGFVVITDGGGEELTVSPYLESGEHENVTVAVDDDEDAELLGRLTATVHQDTTENETYMYEETEGAADVPYLEAGYPVSDSATVTTVDPEEEDVSPSFLVESLAAPTQATTNETVEIVGEIYNPNEFDSQQQVELRFAGEVRERQVLDLEADETREVTFELDTRGIEPGPHQFGIYTDDSGNVSEIELEYVGPNTLEIYTVADDAIAVNVSLTDEGFVAVENASETNGSEAILGTSSLLEPGEHENVTIELAEDPTDHDDLVAVLYAGDPAEPEEATQLEEDGEPVEAPISDIEDDENGVERTAF